MQQTNCVRSVCRTVWTTILPRCPGANSNVSRWARAAAPRPRVLLADEPTGNLDETTGSAIIDLLFDLRDRHGATLVLVTHSHSLARKCDRVIRLRDGRIAEDFRQEAAE